MVYIIRTRKIPFLQSRPSPYLVLSTLGTVILGAIFVLSPLSTYFKFGPLPAGALLSVAGITLGYLVCAEVVKRQFFKRVDL